MLLRLQPAADTKLLICARVFCNIGHTCLVSYRRPNTKIYFAAFPKYIAAKAVKMMRSIAVEFWVPFAFPFITLSLQLCVICYFACSFFITTGDLLWYCTESTTL
jgi:hypothetical protein